MKRVDHLRQYEPRWARRVMALLFIALMAAIALSAMDKVSDGFAIVFALLWFAARGATVLGARLVALRRVFVSIDRRYQNLCTACGYDLTGNASSVCPECRKAAMPLH